MPTGVAMELPDLSAGTLPPGRFRLSAQEIQDVWVDASAFALSTTRQLIWSQWVEAAAALRGAVPVCVAWLGGSFLSDRIDPGDLDCVWVIDDVLLATAKMNPQAERLIAFFSNNQLRDVGLEVDSFVLPWRRRPEIAPRDELDGQYLRRRGYWDDFWQRTRSGTKGSAPTRTDAVPRRGYAEVVLDDFPQ